VQLKAQSADEVRRLLDHEIHQIGDNGTTELKLSWVNRRLQVRDDAFVVLILKVGRPRLSSVHVEAA
jgi:hypothetical protein